MKSGSLFAGIGGFDLGLERAGMTCAWQVEIDPFCNKVLEKHWPNVRRYKDVREVGKHNLEPVELICGGFPCQPHSVAGKRKGAADDRNLWPEYLRIIKEIRPRWVIGENVPGIITTILDQVLSDLETADYTAETLIIPACAFNAPHRRDRVWIVAYAKRQRGPGGMLHHRNTIQTSSGKKTDSSVPTGKRFTFMANTNTTRMERGANPRITKEGGQESIKFIERCGESNNHWSAEPNVGRVANGIPNRVDRLKSLGNAVVPQVVEWIGKRILEVD